MDLYEAMGSQRAVRRLKADPISDAVLARVLTAASWAPTGGNVQPFRMITVQDRQRAQRFARPLRARVGNLYPGDARPRLSTPPRATEDAARRRLSGCALGSSAGDGRLLF